MEILLGNAKWIEITHILVCVCGFTVAPWITCGTTIAIMSATTRYKKTDKRKGKGRQKWQLVFYFVTRRCSEVAFLHIKEWLDKRRVARLRRMHHHQFARYIYIYIYMPAVHVKVRGHSTACSTILFCGLQCMVFPTFLVATSPPTTSAAAHPHPHIHTYPRSKVLHHAMSYGLYVFMFYHVKGRHMWTCSLRQRTTSSSHLTQLRLALHVFFFVSLSAFPFFLVNNFKKRHNIIIIMANACPLMMCKRHFIIKSLKSRFFLRMNVDGRPWMMAITLLLICLMFIYYYKAINISIARSETCLCASWSSAWCRCAIPCLRSSIADQRSAFHSMRKPIAAMETNCTLGLSSSSSRTSLCVAARNLYINIQNIWSRSLHYNIHIEQK